MQKLHKEYLNTKNQIETKLSEIAEKLQEEITSFNAALEQTWDRIDALVTEYNAQVEEGTMLLSTVHDAQMEYMDSRSEAWGDSERGWRYQEWADAWDTELEAIELNFPDPAEEPDFAALDTLRELPEVA